MANNKGVHILYADQVRPPGHAEICKRKIKIKFASFSNIKRMKETKSVWRQDTGESIWTYERGSSGKLEKFYKYRKLAINSL
jgi:hypothetical protein